MNYPHHYNYYVNKKAKYLSTRSEKMKEKYQTVAKTIIKLHLILT